MSGQRLIHLWIDFETTGLNPALDAVLEIGWTLTDSDLRMLTPLRSRLAVLNPDHDHVPFDPNHPLYRRPFTPDFGDDDAGEFGMWDRLPEVVRDMHAASGLRDELAAAYTDATARMALVEHPRDFLRLLIEDLVTVGFDPKSGDKLVISGAGVSHFDVNVLDQHWSDTFPLLPGPGDWAIYWQFDTSVAWRVLGDAVGAEILRRAPKLQETGPGSGLWHLFDAEQAAESSVAHLIYQRRDGWWCLRRDLVRPHRAADDVVEALLNARVMRSADAILRLAARGSTP
ncbi:MAG: hypothetical protein HOY78_02285 [Saccharothrix sp.]|nr:hypothetical protein [Saccharothrix sp.]